MSTEYAAILLPCSHLAERPDRTSATIACHCGRIWHVRLTAGRRAWNAWEMLL